MELGPEPSVFFGGLSMSHQMVMSGSPLRPRAHAQMAHGQDCGGKGGPPCFPCALPSLLPEANYLRRLNPSSIPL